MGCRKYREANPAFSVTKLTGAVAASPAAGIYNLAQVAEVLCNALCLHRCRVALVERPEMVPAVLQAKKPRQVRAIEYARKGGYRQIEINEDGRPALTTSLLLAAIEKEPGGRLGGTTPMSRGNFQPTVRPADAHRGAKVVTELTGET